MKFVSFTNTKAIVMAKGPMFGRPIHYLVTNDGHLYQLLFTPKDCDEYILKEGVFVSGTDLSSLYLKQDGRGDRHYTLPIFRKLNNANQTTVKNFITENEVIF